LPNYSTLLQMLGTRAQPFRSYTIYHTPRRHTHDYYLTLYVFRAIILYTQHLMSTYCTVF